MTIETARLLLRPPRLADAPALFRFLGDPQAMRQTHVDGSLQACRRRIAVHERQRGRDGYAPWAIVSRSDNRLIGWGGLYDDPFDPGWGVEVGYFFHPEAWGQGYATELVRACTEVADKVLRLPAINGFAHPENKGSRRVLEKSGFEELGFVPALERIQYRRAASAERGQP